MPSATDQAMVRICEALGFSEEYIGGLLDISYKVMEGFNWITIQI